MPRVARPAREGWSEPPKSCIGRFLAAAVWLVCLGSVFLTDRIELWLQAAGTSAALLFVWMLTR